jgi:hypothetical protein
MRPNLLVKCLCVACLLYSAVCSAQAPSDCVGPISHRSVQCSGPDGCQRQVEIGEAGIGDYFEFTTNSVSCCGQLISNVLPTGDCDGGGLLKEPGTRDQIYLAAKEFPMLIADCTGRYVPYTTEAQVPDWPMMRPARNTRGEVGQ